VIKYLKKLFRIIFFSRKSFRFPKKNNVIIIDEVGSNKIKNSILKDLDFTILHLREEKIYLPIVLLSFFNFFRYGKNAYKITFIKFVSPKYAFTFIDTSLHICDLMKNISDCKFIIIQNGRRQGQEIEPFRNRVEKNKLVSDYYFVFNENFARFMKKYLKTEFIVGGSLLNNLFKKNDNSLKIKKIQYISEYHTKESVPKNVDYYKWEILPTKFTLETINQFCQKNNLKLEIIGRIENYEKEIEFYKQFKIPFDFLKKTTENGNYNVISNDAIIVGMSSTLLDECFARFFKVAFIDIRNYFFQFFSNDTNLAFPTSSNNKGKFWINKPDKEKMTELLNYLYKIEFSDWKPIVKEWSKHFVIHDYENKIYKNILIKENLI